MKQTVEIRWLGQAGFEITSPTGVRIVIDPYLGDSCMELVGFKRMMPAPMTIEDFAADALLISHEHPDHLDIDLMRTLSKKKAFPVYGNASCKAALTDAGIDADLLNLVAVGDVFTVGDVEITVVPCDHGTQCIDPFGFLLKTGGVCIYFAGDTAYSPELLQPAIQERPDIALLPINGMYGNLNSEQAVKLATDMGCKLLIPCHFWMFVEHGGDPLWLKQHADEVSEMKIVFLAPGETLCQETTV